MSVGVCLCQFVSVDVNKCMDMSEWCLEEVWGVFGWCLSLSVVLGCVWWVT